ncbi:MAG: hypothetical protein K0Q79_3664 [Flavipsychrobacter sp.]|nr:hypothetical protein [Flavipsychrobacter sp.]
MKKLLLPLITITLCCQYSFAQRQCGFELAKAALIAQDPSWAQKYEAHRASLQGIANRHKLQHSGAAHKTTAAPSPIPVIFHFMLTEAQLGQIGGTTGIQQRIDSQIMVLNRDFNKENLDSVLIPAGWKPLYGSSGIRFGLAHTDPFGYGTPGYTLKIIPNLPGGFMGASSNYSSAKHASTGGTDSWDVTKYINIWVTNFADFSSLLGLATYKSITGTGGYPVDEMGMCMNYGAVGKRVSATDYYMPNTISGNHYDMGRTLTHEMGHFFEIWHTWGDDGVKCPWETSGSDDGLADTPPEGGSKRDAHGYNVPNGTYRDSCHTDTALNEVQPYGVASLDFMNYTDDKAMQLFTHDQAAVMAYQVSDSGENFTLTQHPELLNWSPITYVPDIPGSHSLNISPNPSNGVIYVTFDNTMDVLKEISIINTLGQEVKNITTTDKGYHAVDLSNISKGIYFVRCNFASGSVTRKIVLQ